jgi:S-DNA-T family DNA segregation ATPase FtsK/SpoIIIE
MARTVAQSARPAILPAALLENLKRRLIETAGAGLFILSAALLVAVLSYETADPSWNSSSSGPVHNLMGLTGAYTSDLLLQVFGIAAALPSVLLFAWGWRLVTKRGIGMVWLRSLMFLSAIVAASIFLDAFDEPESWPLRTGLGGVTGSLLMAFLTYALQPLAWSFDYILVAGLAFLLALSAFIFSAGLDRSEWLAMWRTGEWGALQAWAGMLFIREKACLPRERIEPVFGEDEEEEADDEAEQASGAVPELRAPARPGLAKKSVVEDKASKAKQGKRAKSAQQGSLKLSRDAAAFQLPPLDFLEAPPDETNADKTDKAALQQNAELLESVLDDFGIKGEIVKVRPGPVVTLYELEPAPGIKTSRVIGLSDDIARSMSALSVRIAVVPGQSVIGIELPNAQRDMVYFRELLASRDFEKSAGALTLVLGKDIGGAPTMVDLARMPHLLIAGTTGSGKSVAINTMICSLLYRLTPDQCRFIMIDPKMLELSVYDGIPNLLAPVVTDPSKAVVALKWAVREMEDRYRLMSQMGVRNITGYNNRLADARKKAEELTRRVQTGFDEAGKPIYEDQPLSMDPLPLIVVVVDEMADLMMVAGKDIEAAIQRLAQMARAAGIHLIMATQRPSVDVITGTIKANFPTRISFQVTSKIDSRTILGEQGAEQLLGQGDMLYMAGGGQITRVHGPFVSDEEVEHIVKFLKDQGEPEYISDVTADAEAGFSVPGMDGGGNSDDNYYDEAVALVGREGKASTSFIQRHLQIGYNRAARIMEQMEEQGVVSQADRVGRREVLIGNH